MLYIIQIFILTFSFITLSFSDCYTYYADIDGDGDGAKSTFCARTELSSNINTYWDDDGWGTNGCTLAGWNDGPSGHLSYGPYISSDPGTTNVTWNMLANGDTDNDGTHIASIDINDATTNQVVAWQNINVNDFNASMAWQDFTLSYWSSADHVYEFRTWYAGQGGHLVLRYITHINEDADTAGAYATTELCDGDDTSGWSLNDDDLMPLCSGNSSDCWGECNIWGGDGPEDGFNCAGDCIEFWSCCELGDLEACCAAGCAPSFGCCDIADDYDYDYDDYDYGEQDDWEDPYDNYDILLTNSIFIKP